MKTYHLANPLQHGDDLKPLQTALEKIKLYGGPIDGVFGQGMAHACKSAKYRLGYPTNAVVPTGGQILLEYLQGTRKLTAAYIARRRARGYGISRAQTIRNKIVQYALWGATNAAQIHYAETRPMEMLHRIEHLPWTSDCSEFITTIYCWAGGPDPNGMKFNGNGYTGTMLDHGVTIPLYQARAADVVIWGAFPGHHTAVIVDVVNKANPMIVSQGSEQGPYHFHLSDENAAQQRPYVVKNYLGA